MHELDKLDEYEEQDILDDSMIDDRQDDELEEITGGYPSDEDVELDDNKSKNQMALSKQNSKKRHLQTQESISDTEFFSQRFDGPGLKSLTNNQESIIEEEETGYIVPEPAKIIPIPRIPTTREVCAEHLKERMKECNRKFLIYKSHASFIHSFIQSNSERKTTKTTTEKHEHF